MNREEAKRTAGATSEHFRPLCIGTMAILEQVNNTVLYRILSGGSISSSTEDLLVFLYVHSTDTSLADVRKILAKGTLVEAAYEWLDAQNPLVVAEGVDYFTDTQTRIELLSVDNLKEGEVPQKKTKQVQRS